MAFGPRPHLKNVTRMQKYSYRRALTEPQRVIMGHCKNTAIQAEFLKPKGMLKTRTSTDAGSVVWHRGYVRKIPCYIYMGS